MAISGACLWKLQPGSSLKIISCTPEQRRIVSEEPEAAIAALAQRPSDVTRQMIVIEHELICLCPADRTATFLNQDESIEETFGDLHAALQTSSVTGALFAPACSTDLDALVWREGSKRLLATTTRARLHCVIRSCSTCSRSTSSFRSGFGPLSASSFSSSTVGRPISSSIRSSNASSLLWANT